jgi:hypothetical protein
MFFHRYCLVILYSYGKVPCILLKLVICNSYVKLMEGSRIFLGCLLVRTENPQVCHAMYHLLMLWNISCTLEPKGTSCPSSNFFLGMCWDIHLPNVCWSVSSFLCLKFIGAVCCWPFPNHFNREREVVNPKKRVGSIQTKTCSFRRSVGILNAVVEGRNYRKLCFSPKHKGFLQTSLPLFLTHKYP